MKRHPKISLRKPEHTSSARAHGFNQDSVNNFYDKYEKLIKEHNIKPECIWNVDETPVSTVPKGTAKVVAEKGKKQVGRLVSAERGEHTTAEICFSAVGNYMPPMIIFPRVRYKEAFSIGAPPGAKVECNISGYMNTDLFFKWMESMDVSKFMKSVDVI